MQMKTRSLESRKFEFYCMVTRKMNLFQLMESKIFAVINYLCKHDL